MSTSFDPTQRALPFFQEDGLRRKILAAYWIAVIIGLPLWWSTTSIIRLSLPEARVQALNALQTLRFSVDLLPVSKVTSAVQLERALHRRAALEPHRWDGLDVRAWPSEEGLKNQFYVAIEDDHNNSSHVLLDRSIIFSAQSASFEQSIDILTELIAPFRSATQEADDQRVAPYSPRFRLAFTLLNEDSSSDNSVHKWEAEQAVYHYLQPTLDQLGVLHDFVVESHIQYYAPLAFEPQMSRDQNGNAISALGPEELKVFVNSAEWSLASSVTNDPVLHFLLYIPSSSRPPMVVLDEHGRPADSNAFIIPQWGGIVVHNSPGQSSLDVEALATVYRTFHTQLLALLGVPLIPRNVVYLPPTSGAPLSHWQISALLRARTRENTRKSVEALQSIVSLVNQIKNMPVKTDVVSLVNRALAALDNVYQATSAGSRATAYNLEEAFSHSRDANSLSSAAFFDPGMLAMLYFPAEHTWAVYTPLFAPIGVPLFVAILREIRQWRKARQDEARRRAKGKGRMDGERTRID